MHAAHYVDLPAVVLWGPTRPDVFGYPRQFHLSSEVNCSTPDGCLGPGKGENYVTPCPCIKEHCIDGIRVDTVYEAIEKVFQGLPSGYELEIKP